MSIPVRKAGEHEAPVDNALRVVMVRDAVNQLNEQLVAAHREGLVVVLEAVPAMFTGIAVFHPKVFKEL